MLELQQYEDTLDEKDELIETVEPEPAASSSSKAPAPRTVQVEEEKKDPAISQV